MQPARQKARRGLLAGNGAEQQRLRGQRLRAPVLSQGYSKAHEAAKWADFWPATYMRSPSATREPAAQPAAFAQPRAGRQRASAAMRPKAVQVQQAVQAVIGGQQSVAGSSERSVRQRNKRHAPVRKCYARCFRDGRAASAVDSTFLYCFDGGRYFLLANLNLPPADSAKPGGVAILK